MVMTRARRRDRRTYLASHPLLYALLAATRRLPVLRLGGTVVVHDESALRQALTRVPLDRLAGGTVGAEARALLATGVLFDQHGQAHRATRRSLADDLGVAGLRRVRPVWMEVLERRLGALGAGDVVDMVDVATELAGATACALLRVDADPRAVARAAGEVASAAVRARLPGPRSRRRARDLAAAATSAADRLTALLRGSPLCADPAGAGLAAMLAVAAINTTIAGLPRAVAWCADDGLWPQAMADQLRPVLVDELLRAVAPIPVMSRVAAAAGAVGGCPVRAGDRLVLVARHAAGAHRDDPDPARPAPPHIAQLVFGVGSHACPGATLARAQIEDTLRVLAPLRPVVRRARADRRAALPGWAALVITPGITAGITAGTGR